jgi:AraC-like DNA-binding protein
MPFMRLQHYTPLPQLQGLVQKLWVFESEGRVPDDDMKLVVPNGLIKLVIPFRNGLVGKMEGCYHLSKENSITLIGLADIPSVVEAQNDVYSGTIGIEFSGYGAYRFFHLNQQQMRNKIYALTEVLGNLAAQLEERISNTENIPQKVQLIQQFLVARLQQKPADAIYDYCIKKIVATKGRITIKQLEKETGYSSRWLNIKFAEKMGVSPKNVASIIRFQQFYSALATNKHIRFLQTDFYDYYYDQSHFIKDFKRFTGHTPGKLAMDENKFGQIFYKE